MNESWQNCEHEWEEVESQSSNDKYNDVRCKKCGCPGVDFTIPAGVKKIKVQFYHQTKLPADGAKSEIVWLPDVGGIETSGYLSEEEMTTSDTPRTDEEMSDG